MSVTAEARESEHPPALEEHVVHPALHRPVLFAGAEPTAVVLEVTTAFALVFGIGLHVGTVLVALFYLIVVHAVMVWVAKQDPQMSALYLRSLAALDFYFGHASVHAATPAVHAAIPEVR